MLSSLQGFGVVAGLLSLRRDFVAVKRYYFARKGLCLTSTLHIIAAKWVREGG